MNPFIIAIGVVTTLAGLVVHIVWWRIKRPADDVLALAVVMGILPLILTFVASCLLPASPGISSVSVLDRVVQLGALSIMHLFIALVYMSCYTAAQAASPTVLMVLMAKNSPHGITKEEIEKHLTDDLVCGNLVQAAIHERFVIETHGVLTMGHRGKLLRRMGRTARKLVGLAAPIG